MEYLNVYVVTFNCGLKLIRPDVLASHISSTLSSANPPDLLIFCLQELAPIAYAFLGGSYLTPYFNQVRLAVSFASRKDENEDEDHHYMNFHTDNVGLTALMAFARTKDVEERIRWIRSAGVGVGLYEMGNKGAVGLRLGWGKGEEEIEITAVSAHLAPMEESMQRRNEDWKNIVKKLIFTSDNGPSAHLERRRKSSEDDEDDDTDMDPLLDTDTDTSSTESGIFSVTSNLIFAGDLNYRTSQQKPSSIDYKAFPQPKEPVSSEYHFTSLLAHDQLAQEIKAQRTCHGLYEAPIEFPPTYKYSVKARLAAGNRQQSENEWLWAKHRWPSWCDRILYLDSPSWMKNKDPALEVLPDHYRALPLMETSDHQAVTLNLRIPYVSLQKSQSHDADNQDVRCNPPFKIDADWRSRRSAARLKEIVVGIGAFLSLTVEGRGVLIALLLGVLGILWITKSLSQP